MTLPAPRDLLPHRGRFLLLTRLLRLDAELVEAEGRFEPADVEGHFPGMPVVPGVLLLEGLAQTLACLDLASHRGDEEVTPLLVGFNKVRFRAPVLPPETVLYRVRPGEQRFGLSQASGEVIVDGRAVCTASIIGTLAPGRLP